MSTPLGLRSVIVRDAKKGANVKSRVREHRILLPSLFSKGSEVSEIINRIFELRREKGNYLEIGVEYGKTFQAVKAKKKTGVDPNFRFHRGFQIRNVFLHEMNSDDFFKRPSKSKWDLVFLDGLHTAKQTYKDFLALLPNVNQKSVVIIDDTVPSDIHSKLPTAEAAYLSRNKAGISNDFQWHGDVYKVVHWIASDFPTLRYVTISDMQNPITIVYGFDKNLSNKKLTKFKQVKRKEEILKNEHIQIPSTFNPRKKSDFFIELGKYFENL
jgi:hypothetical protein